MRWRTPSVNYNIANELSHDLDPGGPLVRALRARAGTLLLITQRIFHRCESLWS